MIRFITKLTVMSKYFILVFVCVLLLSKVAISQDLDDQEKDNLVSWNAYLGLFYAYDFNKPTTDYRQPFYYNQNRHNEFNVNVGLIQVNVEQPKYHAYLGLQVGTYAIDNYAAESEVMQHVYEAYAGVLLNSSNNLWLDVGIFSSHLGFESAISMDNWTLTRSFSAESSPFFLSGAKLTYSPNDSWTLGATVANGWQRIQRVPGNSLPSFGTQVVYSKSGLTLNWSTLVGTDDPDSTRRYRVFNNFYGIIELSNKVRMIAGFDIGMQQKIKGSSDYNYWHISSLITQFDINDKFSTSVRAEYVSDINGVVITSENPLVGFKTSGFSVNLDYYPMPLVIARIESRLLASSGDLFPKAETFSSQNLTIVGSIAVRFK